jgi:micrococcal nuclease
MKQVGAFVVVLAILAAVVYLYFNPVELPTVDAPADSADISLDIPADATTATVDYVHDGDTLFLTDGTKVRLLAVDTPEVGDNLECMGNEARDYLRQLLPAGSSVRIVADVEPTDQYGRSLLFIWTATGTLVNLDLVEQGYAEAVFIGQNRLYEDQVEAAEDAAQDAGRGIWGNC